MMIEGYRAKQFGLRNFHFISYLLYDWIAQKLFSVVVIVQN